MDYICGFQKGREIEKEGLVMRKRKKSYDISTISMYECITEHFYWIITMFFFYKWLLFIPLDALSVKKSRILLVLCILVASFVGIILRWKKCMTSKGVIADIIFGTGIYTILAYRKYYDNWMKIVILISICLLIVNVIIVFLRKSRGRYLFQIRDEHRKKFILKTRCIKVINFTGLMLGVAMFVLTVPILYNRIFNGGIAVAYLKESNISGFDSNYTENELSLTSNIESISKIRSRESWEPLTTQEKLNVLKDVCNCERNYWGMSYDVSIVMDDLAEGTWGAYCDTERRIIIDKQHLENDDPEDILSTVLHEMYHAYEHNLVRLYLDSTESQRKMRVFMHCDEYIKEMVDYQDGGPDFESFMRYYCQYMERDSRYHSEEFVKIYYDEIDLILEEREALQSQKEGEENE